MAGMLVGTLLSILLITLVFYPVIQIIDHLLFTHSFEHRAQEWKLVAAKLVLNEYIMIRIINEERKQLGMPPIPAQAVIEQFDGIGPWATLKTKCAGLVNDALKNVTNIRLS